MRLTPLLIAIPVFVSGILTGCSLTQDTAQWSEEVAQADGSVLRVTRQTMRSGWGNFAVANGTVLGFTLRYEPWGLTWSSTPGNPTEPLTFEIIEGQPVLVVFDEGGKHCSNKKSTDLAARFLLGTPSGWTEFAPEPELVQALHKNLYESYWSTPDAHVETGHMTLAFKRFRERGTDYVSLVDWFAVPGRTCGYFQ
jgi:hypothetical protein